MGEKAPYIPEENRAELILPKVGKCIADLRDESHILWLIRELLEAQKRMVAGEGYEQVLLETESRRSV